LLLSCDIRVAKLEFMVGHKNEMQRTRISFIEEGVLVLLAQ